MPMTSVLLRERLRENWDRQRGEDTDGRRGGHVTTEAKTDTICPKSRNTELLEAGKGKEQILP